MITKPSLHQSWKPFGSSEVEGGIILSIKGICVTFSCIFALSPGPAPRIKPEVDMSHCLSKYSDFSLGHSVYYMLSWPSYGLYLSLHRIKEFNIEKNCILTFCFYLFLGLKTICSPSVIPFWTPLTDLFCFKENRLNHKPNGRFHQPEKNESLGIYPLRSVASELVRFPGV